MEERFVPPVTGEARPMASADGDPRGGQRPTALDDPRALQILTTEHWSLLTARSLVYNEAFARAGMFLAFLSATLLVLGLASTVTGFSDAFLMMAAGLLSLDLFIGLASLGRIGAASSEDLLYLQGMNRLRHAYDEMVPGLQQYFITSPYDDFESVAAFYGPPEASALRGIAHGFTTAPAMISVICCAVAGGLVAVLAMLATHDAGLSGVAGGVAFVMLFVALMAISTRIVAGFGRSLEAKFPRPTGPRPPGR